MPPLWSARLNITTTFGMEETRIMGLPDGVKKFENMFTRFDAIHHRDTQKKNKKKTADRL